MASGETAANDPQFGMHEPFAARVDAVLDDDLTVRLGALGAPSPPRAMRPAR